MIGGIIRCAFLADYANGCCYGIGDAILTLRVIFAHADDRVADVIVNAIRIAQLGGRR